MKQYTVRDFSDVGEETITLHDKQILPPKDWKEDSGSWPFCLSPYDRTCFEPHYSVIVNDHNGEISTLYMAQFFVTDLEYDAFVVEVVHVGDCETHLHISHDTLLNASLLVDIGSLVDDIEYILPQIAEQHDRALGIEEDLDT
jgi:hypothetical protein